jgi:hypothetical protein
MNEKRERGQGSIRSRGSTFCFRLDRKGHAVKIDSFRKAWYRACVAAGLGKMEPSTSEETGSVLYMKPRGPRSKPKVKMVYTGKL